MVNYYCPKSAESINQGHPGGLHANIQITKEIQTPNGWNNDKMIVMDHKRFPILKSHLTRKKKNIENIYSYFYKMV